MQVEEYDFLANIHNVDVSLSSAYERGRTDINFFASLCLPTVSVSSLPLFYLAIWNLLSTRSVEQMGRLLRFALGLPRGHAKTTFLKILICWFIVYDKANFILIICSNGSLAENILADIHDILCSPNMLAVYGNWNESLAIDSADTKKAAYHGRPVTIVARGWASGIRGLNLQNERPDFIFCDDVQTRANDESASESAKLLSELTGTIFKAVAPTGNRIIVYVGNMYSEECILNKFKRHSLWLSMITGAILADGKPLWPELFSLSELMESYWHDEELGQSHIWFAEVMNDPRSHARSLLINPIPPSDIYDDIDLVAHDGSFLTIDPAGYRKESDDNVIAAHVKYNQKAYVVEADKGIMDPQELIKRAIVMALRWQCSLIGVESVAYQQTLKFWLEFWLRHHNISHITVVELKPHGRSKESRIRLFIQALYNHSYIIHSPEVRRDYTWQASLYKIGKPDNKDDLLDAIAYGEDVRNEYWHLLVPPATATIDSQYSVIPNNAF
jgi:hypothetical protein